MELLPVKIQPDNLKDTVVEFHFQSDIPEEVLPGLVYQGLKNSFKIIPRATKSMPWNLGPQNFFQIETHDGMQLTDDCVKIHLRSDSIIFNILGNYPGWSKFSACIYDVLAKLFQVGYLKAVQRVGIRYISEYPGISIFEVMKGHPDVFLPGGIRQNTTYRTEVNYKDCEVVLSIANRVPNKTKQESELTYFSIIDVIVSKFYNKNPISDLNELKEKTDFLHQVEKEFFFGILTKEYLASLSPEYP